MIGLNHRNSTILPDSFDFNEIRQSPECIVIVAPHPDDDVIGCGGVMVKYSEAGSAVVVATLTNGAGTPSGKNRSKNTVINTRQQEAYKGMKIAGAKGGIFLGYDSSDIKSGRMRDAEVDIFNTLSILRPTTVYVPSPFEMHPTHLVSTQITLNAIKNVTNFFPRLRGYSVWGSILAPEEFIEIVDISNFADIKKRAIRAHGSEIVAHAYDDGTIGANRASAVFNDPHEKQLMEFAEQFLIMDELVKRPELDMESFTRNLTLHRLHDMYRDLPNNKVESII